MTRSTLRRVAGAQRPPLSADELAVLRAMLEQQRAFRIEQLGQLYLPATSPVATANQEIIASLIAGARNALRDVRSALRRMDDGSYGCCVACGDQIDVMRLEILPQVPRCMPCERAVA